MAWLRDYPIRAKLTGTILLVSSLTLLIAAVAIVSYEISTTRDRVEADLAALADFIALNTRPALEFNDPKVATENLQALSTRANITAAAIYDEHGELFADYRAPGAANARIPPRAGAPGASRTGAEMEVSRAIPGRSEVAGTVYLRADLASLYARLQRYVLIVAVLFVGLIAMSWALAVVLQRGISKPILDLARLARAVTERADYSLRATKHGDDEIGLLTGAFNQMLSQIQAQDSELRGAYGELERRHGELQREIDERRRAEQRFQRVVEAAPNGMVLVDQDGRITLVNAQAERMFGYARQELLGQAVELLVPREFRARHPEDRKSYFAAPTARQMGAGRDLSALRKDGSEFPVEIGLSPLETERGVMVLASIIDITERKKAEAALRGMTEQLEQRVAARTAQLEAANKELEGFSYSVSHDLRAPLRGVDGFSRILEEEYGPQLDDEGRRIIGVVRDNCRNMGRLIDDLLAFSRLGRKAMTVERVDMNALVEDVLRELRNIPGERLPEVEVAPLPEAECDRTLIRQVWANLLANAAKFTSHKEAPKVRIWAERKALETVYAVADNGAGFDMAYYDKLFGVFQRLHRNDEFPGTGVGLATVQRIVVRHGGRVWAEGKVDVGATFYFALPRGENHA